MKELDQQQQANISAEQQRAEYIQKLRDSIVSGELGPIIEFSKAFKVKFSDIIKSSKNIGEAVRKIGELIIEEAKNVDVSKIRDIVDNPYLLQALFVARKKNENGIVIANRREWSEQIGKSATASEGNETGALLQAICLAYLSGNLLKEEKDDFISSSVEVGSTNDIGCSSLNVRAADAIYNGNVTKHENLEEIQRSAERFRKATNLGRELKVSADVNIEDEIKGAFGEFYAELGNRVSSFLNAVINGNLFNYSRIEEGLARSVRLKDEKKYIDKEAVKVLTFYKKQKGMSDEDARKMLAQRYGGLTI